MTDQEKKVQRVALRARQGERDRRTASRSGLDKKHSRGCGACRVPEQFIPDVALRVCLDCGRAKDVEGPVR